LLSFGRGEIIFTFVEVLNGVPWELDQFPRKFRSQKSPKLKDNILDTVAERESLTPFVQDTATNTANLESGDGEGPNTVVEGEVQVKKVQKAQINALAKMLLALRRS
jgi:hypothetical protein